MAKTYDSIVINKGEGIKNMIKIVSLIFLLLLNPIVPSSNDSLVSVCGELSSDSKPVVNVNLEGSGSKFIYKAGFQTLSTGSAESSLPVVQYDFDTKITTFTSVSYSNSGYITTASKDIVGPSGYYNFSLKNYNSLYNGSKDNLCQTEYEYRPYTYLSPIGRTYAKFNDYYSVGSCFTVGNYTALSAAHCFFKDGVFSSSGDAFFVLQADNVFAHTSNIKKVIIPRTYYDFADTNEGESVRDFDWCICVLDGNVGDDVGYLSVSSGYSMAGCYNFACGYPTISGDTRDGQLCYSAASEVMEPDDPNDTAVFHLYNYLLPGMSGGPVLFYYENSMTFEQYSGVSSINIQRNLDDHSGYAVKISNALIETRRKVENI